MLLGDRQTHWRVERGAGGRHGGVQGGPDGHWGHLIHKPALTIRLDNFELLNFIKFHLNVSMFHLMKQDTYLFPAKFHV